MSSSVPTCPGNANVALAIANQATEILFSTEATVLSLYFAANPGQLSFTGTDGAPIAGTVTPIDANDWFAFRIRPAGKIAGGKTPRIFVAAAVVPTTVRVIAEED